MQYLEQQLEDFKAEFARRRKRQLLVSLPLAAFVILFAVFSRTFEEAPPLGLPPVALGAAVFAIVLGAIAFSLWNWRCPACNKYLGKGISPSFCPKFGVPLR